MDVKSFSSRWLYRNPNQLTFTCLPLQIELSLFSTSRYTKFYSLYIIIFAPQHRNSEGLLILQLYMDSKSPTLTERCGNKNPICFTVPPIAFRSVFHGNKCSHPLHFGHLTVERHTRYRIIPRYFENCTNLGGNPFSRSHALLLLLSFR